MERASPEDAKGTGTPTHRRNTAGCLMSTADRRLMGWGGHEPSRHQSATTTRDELASRIRYFVQDAPCARFSKVAGGINCAKRGGNWCILNLRHKSPSIGGNRLKIRLVVFEFITFRQTDRLGKVLCFTIRNDKPLYIKMFLRVVFLTLKKHVLVLYENK